MLPKADTMYDALRPLLETYHLVPIVPRDKRPAVKHWRDDTFETPVESYARHGVGVICGVGKYPIAAVDIDCYDERVAEMMRDYVLKTFGETVYRVGRAPKVLLVYRYAEPGIRKVCSTIYKEGRVEVLGFGQQFVAYGIHPDTKEPYTWPGIMGDLYDIDINEVPVLTKADVLELISAFEHYAAEAMFEVEKKKEPDISNFEDDFMVDPPVGVSLEEIQSILEPLDADCGYDQWCNVGMAIHHETEGSAEGFLLWDQWSQKGSKYKDGDCERKWESFGKYSGRPVTIRSLLAMTKPDTEPKSDFFSGLQWSTSRFADTPPPIPAIIESVLPKGITALLYSAGGAGKSTLMMYLCAKIALANHREVEFGGNLIHGGSAVIVTAEDPDIILNRRFVGVCEELAQEYGMSLSEFRRVIQNDFYIVSTYGRPCQLFKVSVDGSLHKTSHFDSLAASLKAMHNLQMVVIDTKSRYSPAEGQGNVMATQEISYYEYLTRLTNASLFILHHSSKASRNGEGDGAQAYRDASAIYDSVRAAWFFRGVTAEECIDQGLNPAHKDEYYVLENTKQNYYPGHKPLLVHRKDYQYSLRDFAPKLSREQRADREQEMVGEILLGLLCGKSRPMTAKELTEDGGEDLGIGRRKLIKILDGMAEDGIIERLTDGGKGRAIRYLAISR